MLLPVCHPYDNGEGAMLWISEFITLSCSNDLLLHDTRLSMLGLQNNVLRNGRSLILKRINRHQHYGAVRNRSMFLMENRLTVDSFTDSADLR